MPSVQDITFVIPGQLQVTRAGTLRAPLGGMPGRVKASVRVGTRRAGGEAVRLRATPGEDVVVLHLANGPALMLHPQTARDMLLGQTKATRSAGVPGEVAVPPSMGWQGLEQATPQRTRGVFGDVLLAAVEVLTGFAPEIVADKVLARVDGQVEAGVYTLEPDALPPLKGSGQRVQQVPPAPKEAATLVLLHGTFVDTHSTFGKLWAQHPARVHRLFQHYGGRVYALDHPTLGASPISNALTLAQAMPAGARLHLVTHSRGGLVAEVLARLCSQRTLTKADLALFAGADRADQRRDLQALTKLIVERDLKVERVVRVACPARGTLLASGRLDAYLSVLRWSLDVAGVPVAPALVDFLAAVARQRQDPAKMPGLEAMMPGSPLVTWLNSAATPIAGELRVVAGDLEGDSLGSWVKTLLADAFFWTDNDIVVQTRSMYGGAPRQAGASFLLDQGGRVTHFNYFVNERTAAAVVSALIDIAPAGFRPIGPLSWAGDDAGGLRAARRRRSDAPPAADQPAVILLPGILGTHLQVDGKRVWLGPRLLGGLGQLAYDESAPARVQPDGPIGMFYDDLIDFLADSHEVIPFGFDWRLPIEDEARRLADAVTAALDARQASGQPVRLLAHSMGGIVARTLQLECPAVWQRLMARASARLLMLGTPNAGSWAPMQVLSGDDAFGNALVAFGAPLQDHFGRQLMAAMPGFLQLQAALVDDAQGLARAATWQALADRDLKTVQEANWWHRNVWASDGDLRHLDAYRWGVPPQAVLDRALRLRAALDTQCNDILPAFADKLALVVGTAPYTPDGIEWTPEGLVYRDAVNGGDGRVTHASAVLPGVRSWSLDCEHGSLPAAKAAFGAFLDLLTRGDTQQLARLAPRAARGAAGPDEAGAAELAFVRRRPSRGQRSGARPAESLQELMSMPVGAEGAGPAPDTAGSALKVTVCNGDLTFVKHPLMVGHYRSVALTGTEWVLNRMVGGSMQAALDAGVYPEALGTHQIFVNTGSDPRNPWRAPRPTAAIVIGLGKEGDLKARRLRDSVRQAVIAWAQRLAERGQGSHASGVIAATLMGTGDLRMSPGDSATAIAQGAREAADLLRHGNAGRREASPENALEWPVPTELVIVELYLDRALEAWRSLSGLAHATPAHFGLTPVVEFGSGPRRRPLDNAYRGAPYDLISAEVPADATGERDGMISYRLVTRRARSEVTDQATQAPLVRQLVAQTATDANDDPRFGRTLFQLLIPAAIEPFLGDTDRMVLELNAGTAGIPWELLDSPPERRAGGDRKPWAIRSRLLRKLQTADVAPVVRDASTGDQVLVIGEPALNDPRYPALPGAVAEAREVVQALSGLDGIGARRVTALIEGANATTILNALFASAYRIVHIAGHGSEGLPGGVVLSDNTFLGPAEIHSMRTVPELVFVNCCHLAARPTAQMLNPARRAAFAAGVAESLIRIGVRCVIAAGWAVEDEPAKQFATTLYGELLAGQPFFQAVARAREVAWDGGKSGNTWAAYQCYGDPDWVFTPSTGDTQSSRDAKLHRRYAGIVAPTELALALEDLAVKCQFDAQKAPGALAEIRYLDDNFGHRWPAMGAVHEAFGRAYAEAKRFDAAIASYARAVACNDASASMRATEQWLNLRARQALTHAGAASGKRAQAAGRREIRRALADLDAFARLQPTVERHSLCGSAWKRLALLERRGGNVRAAQAALNKAAVCYRAAEQIAVASADPDLFYTAMNQMATALAARARDAAGPDFDPARVARVRASLQARIGADPDFWSVVGVIELDLYEALAARRLAAQVDDLLARLQDLKLRVAAPRMWSSVADNAEFALAPGIADDAGAEAAAGRRLLAVLRAYAEG